MDTIYIIMILIIATFILIVVINAILIKIKLDKLIKSDRYKDSNYEIHKYHDMYVLLNKTTSKYVCIDNPFATECTYYDSILTRGSKSSVMKAFNQLVPIIY